MLNGKIALVTGASRGIGRGIALALAREGAHVIVNYHGSKEAAEEVVHTIECNGGKAIAMQCNISDFDEAEKLFTDIIKKYERIDILVNNAGIAKDNLLMKMSEKDFMDVIQTNLAGTFHGISINVVTACASGTNCIGEAFRTITYGEADVMLAGGAEASITPLGMAGFTSLNALNFTEDPTIASIPFDKRRRGFVMGEGAGVLY